MFLFWNWIPRITCNDRYCFYLRRSLKSSSLPFIGQSPFGFGIFDLVLALCRRCMIIPVYICILLRILSFLSKNKLLVFITLLYSYILVTSLMNIDFSLYLFLHNFFLEYTINMNPFQEDTIMGESSAMGAANNTGGMPPQLPQDDLSILSSLPAAKAAQQQQDTDLANNPPGRTSHQQNEMNLYSQYNKGLDNPFHKDWRANEVQERSYGWTNENGREICPVTGQAILPDGYCSLHDTKVCISTDGDNPCNVEKAQGHWDPILEKTIPLSLRQRVVNTNMSFNDRYKISYRYSFKRAWDVSSEDKIGEKYLRAYRRSGANTRVRDLFLNGYEKNHVRNLIINDKKCTSYQRWYFKNRNIDFYKVDGALEKHLTNLHLGPIKRHKAKIIRLAKFKKRVAKLNLNYDVLKYYNLK